MKHQPSNFNSLSHGYSVNIVAKADILKVYTKVKMLI